MLNQSMEPKTLSGMMYESEMTPTLFKGIVKSDKLSGDGEIF